MSAFREGISHRQEQYLRHLANGLDRKESQIATGVTEATVKTWLGQRDFRNAFKVVESRAMREIPEPPPFAEFRKTYFGHDTPPHQQEWFKHILGECCRNCMILTFPEAGKTSGVARDYLAWLFAEEAWRHYNRLPYIPHRVAYISNTADFAHDVGWQLRRTLTDVAMHEEFLSTWGPFQPASRDAGAWGQRKAMMRWRDSNEKEPSIQWLGWENNLQGKRLTLAILDDTDTPQMGASDRKQLLNTLRRVVLQRLGKEGRLIIIGNRVDSADIYSDLIESADEADWHVIQQKALLEENVCEWPERYTPEYFHAKRASMTRRDFNLLYQQEPGHGDDAVFTDSAIEASKFSGIGLGEPFPQGVTVAALDPAPDGAWAAVVGSYDPKALRFRLLDIRSGKGGGYEANRDAIGWALRYRPAHFAFEKAGQNSLMLSPEVKLMLQAANCRLHEITTTGQGISDALYGFSAMALWMEQGRFEIPWGGGARVVMGPLTDEMRDYAPDSKRPKDRLMAAWFAFRVAQNKGRLWVLPPAHVPPSIRAMQTLIDPYTGERSGHQAV